MAAPTTLRLRYRPPFDWAGLLAFLGPRAVAGVEAVEGARYSRVFRHGGAPCRIEVRDDPGRARLVARLWTDAPRAGVALRLRRAFDLDAEPALIAARLGADPVLAPLIAARPGLRVPGSVDAFELAVRAVLGQQISVTGARTLAGRIATRWGEPAFGSWRLFPTAQALAAVDLTEVGVMPARARTIAALAAALADDPDLLDPARPARATRARLLALPGIGPWTADYIALRALGDRDAFPAGDLGLAKALAGRSRPTPAALARRAEAWRPWRAYAALLLWSYDAASRSSTSRASGTVTARRSASAAASSAATSRFAAANVRSMRATR